jgi:hypothetical protein
MEKNNNQNNQFYNIVGGRQLPNPVKKQTQETASNGSVPIVIGKQGRQELIDMRNQQALNNETIQMIRLFMNRDQEEQFSRHIRINTTLVGDNIPFIRFGINNILTDEQRYFLLEYLQYISKYQALSEEQNFIVSYISLMRMFSNNVQNGGKINRPNKKTRKTRKIWSLKYKKSINCKRPRGFSQRQYCKYGRKKS